MGEGLDQRPFPPRRDSGVFLVDIVREALEVHLPDYGRDAIGQPLE